MTLSLTCSPAHQTAEPLWATCSRDRLSWSWKPFLYIMFEPPRNTLWPLSLFLLPRTSKKSLDLSPLADAGRLPLGSSKASLFQAKKPMSLSFSSQDKCSGHSPLLMALKTLTCRILHGLTLKVPARKLQIHIMPKTKNCLPAALRKFISYD